MNSSTKIALAVMGGYVLGRRRKVKLAILLGSVLLGKRLDVRSLGREAWGRLNDSEEVGQIRDRVRDELASSGRAAATAAMSAPINRIADSLHKRTESLSGDGSQDKADADGKARARDDEPEPRDEDEAEDEPRKRPRARGSERDEDEDEDEEPERESARTSEDEEEDEDRPRRRRTPARSKSGGDSGRVPRARSEERRRPAGAARRSSRER